MPYARRQHQKASAATGLAIPPHGPGGLLSAPGVGRSRARRRQKEAGYGARGGQQIRGRLYRGEDGKFSSGGGGSAPRSQVAAKRRERAQQRREQRAAEQAAEARTRGEEDAQRGEEQPKGGGGGGGKKKPTEEEQRAEQAKRRAQTASTTAGQVGLAGSDLAALRQAAEGTGGSPALDRLGLTAGGEATDQGRRALAALERGDVRGYRAALQDASARLTREQARRDAATGAERRRAAAAQERQRRSREQAPLLVSQIQRNLERRRGKAVGGLAVYKDAAGHDRWLSISSTAYRDKDGEIVSRQALARAVASADATGYRGPLRFWHVAGVDIGDCDYQATAADGRLLIESGTFRRPDYAAAVKARGQGYQVSIGFVHPAAQPDADGVFSHIAIFERSIVPPGRASNPFTSITTKEERMTLPADKDELLAQLLGGKDSPAYQAATAQIAQTDKAAQDAGVTYKDAPPWAQQLISDLQALGARVKAVETKAPMPPAEMEAAGATELDDGAAEAAEADSGDGTAAALMDDDAFIAAIAAKVVEALGPQIGELKAALGFEKKLTDAMGELKSMFAPVAAKDDARAAALAALAADVATLKGEMPRAAQPGFGAGVWGQLTGAPVNEAQVAALKATPATGGGAVPAGLSEQEQAAYALLYGGTE